MALLPLAYPMVYPPDGGAFSAVHHSFSHESGLGQALEKGLPEGPEAPGDIAPRGVDTWARMNEVPVGVRGWMWHGPPRLPCRLYLTLALAVWRCVHYFHPAIPNVIDER